MKKLIKTLAKFIVRMGSGWKCPECGSTNTVSGTYYDKCNDCGFFQGY